VTFGQAQTRRLRRGVSSAAQVTQEPTSTRRLRMPKQRRRRVSRAAQVTQQMREPA